MKISRLLFLSLLTTIGHGKTRGDLRMPTPPFPPRNISSILTRLKEGVRLTAQDGAFDSEVEAIALIDFNVTGLSRRSHLIGIRYKDNNNTWEISCVYPDHSCVRCQSFGQWIGWFMGGNGTLFLSASGWLRHRFPPRNILSILIRVLRFSGIAFQAKDSAFDSEVESILPKDLNVTGQTVRWTAPRRCTLQG